MQVSKYSVQEEEDTAHGEFKCTLDSTLFL